MRYLLPALCLGLFAVSHGMAADAMPGPVTVKLTSGRVISGHVDARTSDSHLQLTLATGRIRLTTPIPWTGIESVSSGKDTWSRDEFQGNWQELAIEVPAPKRGPDERDVKMPMTRKRIGRVESIFGDAWIAHWNRRPDADGLALNLVVLNAAQEQIEIPGQLDVQLIGREQGKRGGRLTLESPPRVLILERWSYQIRSTDFQNGAVRVRLPFRRLRPQQAIDVADDAFLRVRFGVPSQGVFELSLPDVFIRDFSLFRDELYHATGSRLLPFEKP